MEVLAPPSREYHLKKARLAKRRAEVAEALSRGLSQLQMVKTLDLTLGQVKSDLRIIERALQVEMVGSAARHKAVMIHKIRRLASVAWAEWERSRQEQRKTRQKSKRAGEGETAPVEVTIEKTERIGDIGFLNLIATLYVREMELLGIAAPVGPVVVDQSVTVENKNLIVVSDSGQDTDMPWMKTLRRGRAEQGQPLLEEGQLRDETTEPVDATLTKTDA